MIPLLSSSSSSSFCHSRARAIGVAAFPFPSFLPACASLLSHHRRTINRPTERAKQTSADENPLAESSSSISRNPPGVGRDYSHVPTSARITVHQLTPPRIVTIPSRKLVRPVCNLWNKLWHFHGERSERFPRRCESIRGDPASSAEARFRLSRSGPVARPTNRTERHTLVSCFAAIIPFARSFSFACGNIARVIGSHSFSLHSAN